MVKPVSVHDGPFSTNALPSKTFLIPYLLILWASILPIILEIYLLLKLIKNIIIFIVILPFFLAFIYLSLFFTSLLISKISLLLINKIHPPKEGIFRREKSNKDYYFWCLRSVIKKWTIWLTKFMPSQIFDIILLKIYGVNISFTSSIKNVVIDTEFISIGKNVSIGPNSYIRSSMIFSDFLILKEIKIKENVTIGSRVFISPGTIINKSTILNSFSVTKLNQILQENSFYNGYGAKKNDIEGGIHKLFDFALLEKFSNKTVKNDNIEMEKVNRTYSNNKFMKNFKINLLIFFLIYLFSYNVPLFILLIFNSEFLIPVLNNSFTLISVLSNVKSFLVILFTPVIYISLYFLHLLLVVMIVKIIYVTINRKTKKFHEGIYHWSETKSDYKYYFVHSFLMRILKWKIQRSIFPWITKWCFSFIGNCKIGKNTVLEDMYLAKDYLEIGNNCYLGKILLTNHLWGESLYVKSIKIKDNVVICDGTSISPGTCIEKNVSILPLSSTLKSDDLDKKTHYYNTPVNTISEKDLISKFNLNLNHIKNDN
ncbi:MAG: hypothetical protein P8Y97_17210 [Candidatus Lokiarchaeota archaeon]